MKTITFQNNLEDWEAYLNYSMLKTSDGLKWGKRIYLYSQISYLITAFIIYGFSRDLKAGFAWLIILEVLSFFRSGFKPIQDILQREVKKRLKAFSSSDLGCFSMQKTLEVSENGMTITNKDETHSFNWTRINKIEKTDQHIVIFNGMRTVWVVPKRAFETTTDFDSFYESIQRFTNKNMDKSFPFDYNTKAD